jgi:hypothetical protein
MAAALAGNVDHPGDKSRSTMNVMRVGRFVDGSAITASFAAFTPTGDSIITSADAPQSSEGAAYCASWCWKPLSALLIAVATGLSLLLISVDIWILLVVRFIPRAFYCGGNFFFLRIINEFSVRTFFFT